MLLIHGLIFYAYYFSHLETSVSGDYYISLYPYQSDEAGDLTFDQGEVILVTGKDGDWWTGQIGDRSGIFPSNYVQTYEVSSQNTQV